MNFPLVSRERPVAITIPMKLCRYLILVLVSASAWATNLYISPSGTDTGNCQNIAAPCLTYAYAESQSLANDTINAVAGTYRLAATLSNTSNEIVAKAGQTLTGPACTPVMNIASFTGTSGTLTFAAVNNLAIGDSVTLVFPFVNSGLNFQVVTVLAAGLSGSQFEATVTGTGYVSGAGTATTNCKAIFSGGVALCNGTFPCTGPDGDGNWAVTGMIQHGQVNTVKCDPGWAGCNFPEDLFFDGTVKRHVNSTVAVTAFTGTAPGTLTFTANNTLVVGNTVSLASCTGNAGLNQVVTVSSVSGDTFQAPVTGGPYTSGPCTGTVTNIRTTLTTDWWFDYTNHIIYFHQDPTAHVVETSVQGTIFSPNQVNNLTIQNVHLTEFASVTQAGAIDVERGSFPIDHNGGLNWTVQNISTALNHGAGVRIGFGMQILNSWLTNNGQTGVGGGAPPTVALFPSGTVDQGNVVTFNNFAHIAPVFGAGGIKYGNTLGGVIKNNIVINNLGQGIHMDDNSAGQLIDGNTVTGNTDGSIGTSMLGYMSETGSWNLTTIRNNYLGANGINSGRTTEFTSVDGQDEGYCNVIESNNTQDQPLFVQAPSRATYGVNNFGYPNLGSFFLSQGNTIHHNTVIFDTGANSLWGYFQNDASNQGNFWTLNTPPDFNQFHMAATSEVHFVYDNDNTQTGTHKTFAQYQASTGLSAAPDAHGSADTNNAAGFPTVSISSPADQATFNNSATIAATASDAGSITKAEMYLDWVLQQTINTAGPYSFTLSGAGAGLHTVAVMAYSAAGVRNCNAVTLTNVPIVTGGSKLSGGKVSGGLIKN